MKRLTGFLCAMLTLMIGCAALQLFSRLPADSSAHIQQKYAGWSGVLQACVCSRWQAGGSFIRWLNRCAADFEKAHDGVYIEFMDCAEEDLGGIADIYSPDIIFFSPGVISDESAASCVQAVCMGGYGVARNTSFDGGDPAEFILPDTAALCYSAAAIALSGGTENIPDSAMDIGLTVSAADAYSRFTAGEIPCIAVSAKDISRLIKLSESGRGPEWEISCPAGPAFTDQVLYMMTPAHLPDDGRAEVIHSFADHLLSDDCQGYLSDIGAMPVCGGSIYPARSPYAAVEVSLQGEVLTPPAFSEYSIADCGDIVRSFRNDEIDKNRAVRAIIQRRCVKGG